MASSSMIGSIAAQTIDMAMQSLTAPGAKPAFDPKATDPKAKARQAAVDFESVFLNTMFSQMATATEGEGPFGGQGSGGVWRSFLTDEYAKTFAKSGGIGISDHVYRSLIAMQEAR